MSDTLLYPRHTLFLLQVNISALFIQVLTIVRQTDTVFINPLKS